MNEIRNVLFQKVGLNIRLLKQGSMNDQDTVIQVIFSFQFRFTFTVGQSFLRALNAFVSVLLLYFAMQ